MMEFLNQSETWIAVAWAIAFGFLFYKAWTPIMAALDLRSAQIGAELNEARALREEAEAMLADYVRKQKEAAQEAHDIVEHAQSDAERLIKDAVADLDALLARRTQQGKERIRRLEAEALSEIRAIAAEIALNAARQVLIESIDFEKGNMLIEASIASLPAALGTAKLGVTAI